MSAEKSGFYYPNKMARLYVLAIEETIGPAAMKAVLEVAGVPPEFYPPPNNFAKEFDFAYYSGIGAALEKLYGLRGKRGLLFHAGQASFAGGLAEFGAIIGVSELTLKTIPTTAKLKVGLKALAETFSKFSDVVAELAETNEHFVYTLHRCPACWGRTTDRPVCYSQAGIIDAGVRWGSSGKTFRVEEVACHAAGDPACVFHIHKTPLE